MPVSSMPEQSKRPVSPFVKVSFRRNPASGETSFTRGFMRSPQRFDSEQRFTMHREFPIRDQLLPVRLDPGNDELQLGTGDRRWHAGRERLPALAPPAPVPYQEPRPRTLPAPSKETPPP